MALGSYSPSHHKGEIYSFSSFGWTDTPDYPYSTNDDFYDFSIVYITEHSAYYVIGGYSDGDKLSQIGKYSDGAWSDAGQLNNGRYGAKVQWLGNSLIVAGGTSSLSAEPTEKCTLDGANMFTCTDITPTLDGWSYFVSFLIPEKDQFC